MPKRMFIAPLLLGVVLTVLPAAAQTIVQRHTLFSSGKETPFQCRVWNMSFKRAPGRPRDRGICLWFNTEYDAKPWAGMSFEAKDASTLTLTEQWIENGFIRILFNSTLDRHGNIGGRDAYQVQPRSTPQVAKYQAIRSQFIDRGRGIDQEASTWQEILIPLRYFTNLKPGHVINGLSFLNRDQIELAYSVDDIEYVRYDRLPDWMVAQLNEDVKQAWVQWPAFDELPKAVRADQTPLSIRNGSFVSPDGSRAFLLNPYLAEDARASYGNKMSGKLPPTYDLYDREQHGWIYDEYMSGRFNELIKAGVATVNGILPDTLVGLQPMGGYLRTPHGAVWKHQIAELETMVLTPTGGGRWTRGSSAFGASVSLTEHSMADAPIENDLLLAVSGEKMIVDNETYLRGQTRADTRNRLWEHVVCGLDGITIFSWAKRGWIWSRNQEDVRTDADKFPYSSLIPLARRTDALRGILDFSEEIQRLAPVILPKPWGPEPKIGIRLPSSCMPS